MCYLYLFALVLVVVVMYLGFKVWLIWDFSGSSVVKTGLPMQREQVWSLTGELRSHTLHSTVKKAKNKVWLIFSIFGFINFKK